MPISKTITISASARLAPGKHLAHMLNSLGRRHPLSQVFRDWVEYAAIEIANRFDRSQFPEREKRFLAIARKYEQPDRFLFPEMLIYFGMEFARTEKDVFGPLVNELELGSRQMAQHVTPWEVSYAMARMTFASKDKLAATIEENGYITALEPACGAGGMCLAVARVMEEAGFNYPECLHVTAIDIDPMCTQMTFIQTSLLAIPAIVYHGNTLADKIYEHWLTPMHVLGHWDRRLAGENPPPRLVGDEALEKATRDLERMLKKVSPVKTPPAGDTTRTTA